MRAFFYNFGETPKIHFHKNDNLFMNCKSYPGAAEDAKVFKFQNGIVCIMQMQRYLEPTQKSGAAPKKLVLFTQQRTAAANIRTGWCVR